MRKHFTDPAQASRSETKMRELRYKGDTSQYLAELLELNTDVTWTGPSFQKLIARALPKKVIELVYSKRGVLPTLDQEYLQAVGEAGRTYELMQEDDALRTTRHSEKGEPDSISGRSKSGQLKSKDKPRPHNSSNPSSKDTPKSRFEEKDRKWTDFAAALAGVNKDAVDQRKKDGKCFRCGRDHHTLVCFAKKDVDGHELPTPPVKISSNKKKRSRDDSEDQPS
ncbi:hypothetical protein QBC35DRAFT_421134, partial [Podospora australis]